jgi:3-mercaptopyruvate sulfurtransferase SseA
LGHGDVLIAEGRLEFKADKVKEVAEMTENAHAESEESTFVPSRDMDELNYALQCKEHPGHAHGYGNRPWKHTLKSTADSYGKKRKHVELFKEKMQEMCITFCKLGGKRCTSYFKGIYKNRCKHNYNNYWPNKEMIWSYIALVGIIAVVHPQLL